MPEKPKVVKLDATDAVQAGTLYDHLRVVCTKTKASGDYVKNMGGNILTEKYLGWAIMPLLSRAKGLESSKMQFTVKADCLKFFALKPEDRAKYIATDIGEKYIEPVTSVLISTVCALAGIVEMAYLFNFGFKYSREIATFMFEDKTDKIELAPCVPNMTMIHTAIKSLLKHDGEEFVQYYETALPAAFETCKASLQLTEKTDLSLADVNIHHNVLQILFNM